MWKDKPAFFAAAVMAAGFIAARVTAASPLVWAVCSIPCLVMSVAALYRARAASIASGHGSLFPAVLLFCSSALWYTISFDFESDHITNYLHIGRPVRIVCRVADEPAVRSGRVQAVVNVMSLGLEEASIDVCGNALLTVVRRPGDQAANVAYGDVIRFDAVLEEPQETRNPGEVSYRDYLALNNVYGMTRVAHGSAITVIERRSAWLFDKCIFPVKHFVSRVIYASSAGDEGRYLAGLLLGDRSDISKEIQQAFANTGTIHILAVSGSHVVVIVAAVYALFGMLRIPSRPKICATIAAIMFYMLLTGSAPSVVRASLMTAVVLAGKLVQRRSSVYNCLGASAVLMFLYDPKQVFDVGFQLSFAAVFSMVYFYPRLTAWTSVIPRSKPWGRTAAAAVGVTAVSAAAQIGTIPFTAFYFEKISLISLFTNLFVVPLAGLNITIGLVSILLSAVSSWIGSCFTEVNTIVAHVVLAAVKASNQIPFAIVHTASFGLRETLLYVIVTAMVFNCMQPAAFRRLFLVLFFIVDCFLIQSSLASQTRLLRMTFFDVGQGDAALVEFPGGASMLIDAGPRSAFYDAGEKVIVPGLRRRGIHSLSALLVTHAHDDHTGGIPAVLSEIGANQAAASIVRAVKIPASGNSSPPMPDETREVRMGDRLTVHTDARIYVLHPPPGRQTADSGGTFADMNNSSVVIRLAYGKISFLLMGDAERDVEKMLVDRYGGFLRSDVIKLGHHGSSTGSSEELLRAVGASEAVISVGRFNAFHHPSPSTIRRLRQFGVRMHRTDREGAVVFETDGETLRRVPWREDARMHGLLR